MTLVVKGSSQTGDRQTQVIINTEKIVNLERRVQLIETWISLESRLDASNGEKLAVLETQQHEEDSRLIRLEAMLVTVAIGTMAQLASMVWWFLREKRNGHRTKVN